MTGLDDVDLAVIGPCPGCKTPVRRFPSVPIRGNGLDAQPAERSWCTTCLQTVCLSHVSDIDPTPGRTVIVRR